MSVEFGYSFPAIRGVQAGREYYVSMCPIRLIPKIFLFDEEELVPELRAQRILNKSRLPEMARYIVENPDNYVFSAITASIDGELEFQSLGAGDEAKVGMLRVSMESRFIINDGQHRRAAIEMALRDNPDLADETIAVVFFVDRGLQRCQQMFADLNRYAIRPSKSIGVLYDHRDDLAIVVKHVVGTEEVFRGRVEMEKSTLSARSRKLFTLSAIYSATGALLDGLKLNDRTEAQEVAGAFWATVGANLPEWQQVLAGQTNASELRQDYIHSHAVFLQAIGRVGNSILRRLDTLKAAPTILADTLEKLQTADWSRMNPEWEGRALVGGRVSKANQNVILTTNLIKQKLGIALNVEEQRLEDHLQRGNDRGE